VIYTQGGEMMKEGQANRFVKKAGVSVKASPVDFVTEVDEAVEKMIRTAIAERYPSHQL
jgi:myo-inositol-1(or 4)-monophosphatase